MPDCIVFDLDGTLFSIEEYHHYLKKEPKDWDAFFAGIPHYKVIEPVARVCRMLASHVNIIYATGRSEEHIRMTYDALNKADLPRTAIYHRKKGDFREDTVLKLELLDEIKRDGFNIIMLFDDRKRVVSAMRLAGYCVAQVAEGDY